MGGVPLSLAVVAGVLSRDRPAGGLPPKTGTIIHRRRLGISGRGRLGRAAPMIGRMSVLQSPSRSDILAPASLELLNDDPAEPSLACLGKKFFQVGTVRHRMKAALAVHDDGIVYHLFEVTPDFIIVHDVGE